MVRCSCFKFVYFAQAVLLLAASSSLAQEASSIGSRELSSSSQFDSAALQAIAAAIEKQFELCGRRNRMPSPVNPASDSQGCLDVAPIVNNESPAP